MGIIVYLGEMKTFKETLFAYEIESGNILIFGFV